MNSSAWAARATAMTSSIVASGRPNRMLSATLSEKRNVSSITDATMVRSDELVTARMSCPSIATLPASGS